MTFDPSLDYLGFDFLVSVLYQCVTADGEWMSPADIGNCSTFDAGHFRTSTPVGDFQRTSIGLIIHQPEWLEQQAVEHVGAEPQRGDKFVIAPLYGGDGTVFSVQEVISDYFRLKQWRLKAFSIPGPASE